MPITNITHNAFRYTVQLGVSAKDLYTYHTWQQSYSLYAYLSAGCVCIKNYSSDMMQPSSSMHATIVSAENQNYATIVEAIFFCRPYYTVWESNNAGEAWWKSWNESLKSRYIPRGLCGYLSGAKRKHFTALSSPRPCWRWLQLQPLCGFPQWSVDSEVDKEVRQQRDRK